MSSRPLAVNYRPLPQHGEFEYHALLSIEGIPGRARRPGSMEAQALCRALNQHAKAPQFSNSKARATARQDPHVDWTRTKAYNADFNPDVDGCESFVMTDGSVCAWVSTSQSYVARPRG